MLWPINCICQKDGLDKYSVGLRKSLGVAGVDESRTRVRHVLVLLDNVQAILSRQTSTYTRVGKRKYANIGK